MTNPKPSRPKRHRCAGRGLFIEDEFCGVLEGELHQFGCDMEMCSQCSGQYLYCDCPEPRDARRRAPFFQFPQMCAKCGTFWPEFFNVPNTVWKHYILELGQGDKLICVDCWDLIIVATDGGTFASQHGNAIMLDQIGPHAPAGSEARARWDKHQRLRQAEADEKDLA